MQSVTLGTSDISVSPIGLATGTLRSDRDVWSPGDENEFVASVHMAVDLGITLIDTAPAYGQGQCESLLGKALIGRRDRVVLATKCGLLADASSDAHRKRCLAPESVVAECEASLRRLRTETIDLLQLHWPDPESDLVETFAALTRLIDAGKVRAVGLANFGLQRLADACAAGPVASLQTAYSLLDRQADDDLIPYCHKNDIALLADDPLLRGLLTGTFDASRPLSATQRRDPQFQSPRFERNLARVDRLRSFAALRGWPLRQLAIAWVMHRPGVTATLTAARRPSEVRDARAAADLTLSQDDQNAIEAHLADAA
jgi:aryl-alcohol dehydrogenase-like predicted oxidoreductase